MKVDDLLRGLDPSGPLTMKRLAEYITANTSDTASVALVYIWRDKGIPPLRQLEFENMTSGRLRAGPECDRYRVPHVAPDAPATGPGALDEQAAA